MSNSTILAKKRHTHISNDVTHSQPKAAPATRHADAKRLSGEVASAQANSGSAILQTIGLQGSTAFDLRLDQCALQTGNGMAIADILKKPDRSWFRSNVSPHPDSLAVTIGGADLSNGFKQDTFETGATCETQTCKSTKLIVDENGLGPLKIPSKNQDLPAAESRSGLTISGQESLSFQFKTIADPDAEEFGALEIGEPVIGDTPVHTELPRFLGADAHRVDAITFAIDAEDPIVVIEHRHDMEVPYGTVAAWINPFSVEGIQTLIAQDEQEQGDCGRFRIAMDSDRIFLGLSDPYDGSRHDWVTEKPVFKPGRWTHVAVTFDNQGATVFVDGLALDDRSWCRIAGPVQSPSEMVDFSLENNHQPIVLGCEGKVMKSADTIDTEQVDQLELCPFTGIIGDFGLWGGFVPQDALNAAQISTLARIKPDLMARNGTNDSSISRPPQNEHRRREPVPLRTRQTPRGQPHQMSPKPLQEKRYQSWG